MCENGASILIQRRHVTLWRHDRFPHTTVEKVHIIMLIVHVQAAGITIKSVYDSLPALEDF